MSLNTLTWKSYRFGDLINSIYKATAYTKDDLEEYYESGQPLNYITRTANNNGCEMTVVNNGDLEVEAGNAITIGDTTATCFYQDAPFVCGDHMVVIRADWINQFTGLFIVALLQQEQYRYSYGRAFIMENISNTVLKLPKRSDGSPDWDCVETIIKGLKYKPISSANHSGHKVNTSHWKKFVINDLFEILNGSGITKEEIADNPGDFTAVQSGEEDNGRIGMIDKGYCIEKGYTLTELPCLTVARSGSAGFVSFHEEGCVVGDSAKILLLKNKEYANKYVYLFLNTILTANRYKYSYGRKVTVEKYKEEMIMLPATEDNEPNWDMMQDYVKSLRLGDRI